MFWLPTHFCFAKSVANGWLWFVLFIRITNGYLCWLFLCVNLGAADVLHSDWFIQRNIHLKLVSEYFIILHIGPTAIWLLKDYHCGVLVFQRTNITLKSDINCSCVIKMVGLKTLVAFNWPTYLWLTTWFCLCFILDKTWTQMFEIQNSVFSQTTTGPQADQPDKI